MTDIRREKREGLLVWTCLNCMMQRQIPAISSAASRKPTTQRDVVADIVSAGRLAKSFRLMLLQGRIPERMWQPFKANDVAQILGSQVDPRTLTDTIKCMVKTGEIIRIRWGLYKLNGDCHVRTA